MSWNPYPIYKPKPTIIPNNEGRTMTEPKSKFFREVASKSELEIKLERAIDIAEREKGRADKAEAELAAAKQRLNEKLAKAEQERDHALKHYGYAERIMEATMTAGGALPSLCKRFLELIEIGRLVNLMPKLAKRYALSVQLVAGHPDHGWLFSPRSTAELMANKIYDTPLEALQAKMEEAGETELHPAD